ncbi:glycoside hydrolase family 6 protein [Nocardioides plantarum]|uniref:Glucanase n=1 Tax=Nocardioides plantarum TaxID=29299 RepID=A0ABV5K9X7_9ACTN|nr:glycoside hydrolase family 6 protein [Nocardioides plantarum]
MPIRPLAQTAALAVATLVLASCGASDESGDGPTGTGDGNPFAERAQTVLANPRLTAAVRQAEADGDTDRARVLERLAKVPTGIWLTPEAFPAGRVGPYVAGAVGVADGADGGKGSTVPLFVVYGIPDRDCTGGFSAGGLTDETYVPWVSEIAAAAGDRSVVVLEPDALASSVSCGDKESRIRLLKQAVGVLDAAGVTTYVDAGHSAWVPAATMAELLRAVDVGSVRGFATDVANYQPLSRERAYAAQLSKLLDGAHYVIDTGRSGASSAAGTPVDDWCNPEGQSLGENPGFVDDGTGLDALLWIKPPAESDGTCHGGPPAGDIWLDRAVRLAEDAGW